MSGLHEIIDPLAEWHKSNGSELILIKKIEELKRGRKMLLLWGNCQVHVYGNLLLTNKEFREKYVILKTPVLWRPRDEESLKVILTTGVLSTVDVCISQNISKRSKFGKGTETEEIFKRLKQECERIIIPKLYFKGYYPQIMKNSKAKACVIREILPYSMNYIDREVIEKLTRGYKEEEIVREISDVTYYDNCFITNRVEKELELFVEREMGSDIKIGDFLQNNYKHRLMFATFNHPTSFICIEMSKRILEILTNATTAICCEEKELFAPMPEDMYYPIYPSVLYTLRLSSPIYTVKANVHADMTKIFIGISEAIDESISGYMNKSTLENGVLSFKASFEEYMSCYIRVLKQYMEMTT